MASDNHSFRKFVSFYDTRKLYHFIIQKKNVIRIDRVDELVWQRDRV